MSDNVHECTSDLRGMLCFLVGIVSGGSLALVLARRAARSEKASRPKLHVDDAAQVERGRLLQTER